MKKILLGFLLVCFSLVSWRAWSFNQNPTPGSVWTWLGPTLGADWIQLGDVCPSINTYGGDPTGSRGNDDAWAAFIKAQTSGGAHSLCVSFPPGTYLFSGQIVANLTANDQSINIVGSGPDITNLYWPAGGGLRINGSANRTSFHLAGFSCLTGAVNTGICIDAEWGTQHNDNMGSSTIEKIKVSALNSTIGTNYWATGIKLNGVSVTNLYSVDIFGKTTASPAGTCIDTEAPGTNLSFIYNFVSGNIFGCQYGLLYGSNVQGISISGFNFTLNTNGIYIPVNAVGQSELNIVNSQFDNYGDNILFDTNTVGTGNVQLVNNLFFLVPNTSAIHMKSLGVGAQLLNNQIASASGLITATGILVDNNFAGQNLIADTTCQFISTCIALGAGTSLWTVKGTLVENVATTITNAGTNNTITGLNIGGSVNGNSFPVCQAVSGAVNNGSGLIRLTVASSSVFVTGQVVAVGAVGGINNLPGLYSVTVIDGTHIDLISSVFSGTYSASSGTVCPLP